jgi:hypothetical protein
MTEQTAIDFLKQFRNRAPINARNRQEVETLLMSGWLCKDYLFDRETFLVQEGARTTAMANELLDALERAAAQTSEPSTPKTFLEKCSATLQRVAAL